MFRLRIQDSLLFLFFFSSGFAALLYQVVWLKYLNLLFGSTTYATAAILCAFMLGLSLGSRLVPRFPVLLKASLRYYGLAEIGIGLFAVLFPVIYSSFHIPSSWIFNLVGPESFLYNFLTFLVASLVLLIPTSFMGATLPLLSHYLVSRETVAPKTGLLYGINTVGAVAGILFSAFLFIPVLGLHATLMIGVLINLLVGLLCYLAGKEQKPQSPGEAPEPKCHPSLLYCYGISGMLAISYEVVWTRLLVLHLGSSVYAYAIMLSVFLLGISLGSYAGGRWIVRRSANPVHLFGWIQAFWAFAILLQVLQFRYLSDTLYHISSLFGTSGTIPFFLVLFLAALQVLFLPTFLSGILFPLVAAFLTQDRSYSVPQAVSLAYSFNTVGGIMGSLVAGFILIPLMGTQKALLVLASVQFLLFLLLYHGSWLLKIAPTLVYIVLAVILQKNVEILTNAGIFEMDHPGEKLLHIEEDVSATVTVEKRFSTIGSHLWLSVNGVNVAGTSPSLVSIQKLQGHIPLILYGPSRSKRVLHIGFGSGGTAYSVSLYPHTNITVVELSRAVVRNADQYFRSVNGGIVGSGKLRFIYFDGRSFLQNSKETFDLILSDSIHPRYSGNGSLYTKDYYRLVYDHLNTGGVHSQWIPLYSLTVKNLKEILKAFYDVFPSTYVWYINSTVNPYLVVTGQKGSTAISFSSIQRAFSVPAVREDLRLVSVFSEYHLLDYFLFGRAGLEKYLDSVEPHLDDRMTVEYESALVRNRKASWWLNYQEVLRYRENIRPYLQDPEKIDGSLYSHYFEASTDNLQGQLYFIEGKYREAMEFFRSAQQKNNQDSDPVERTYLPS